MKHTIKTRLIAAVPFLTTLLSFTAPAFAAADYSELISSILDDMNTIARKLLQRAPAACQRHVSLCRNGGAGRNGHVIIFVSKRLCNAQSL